ncbi:hypothetical protein BU25DRAFT_451198 [Macroventuria anomochaeta]|uniref:Uncharacterized protein n=1 Tax=Macroventuria anomochaeta TaxID=301207 RepID=A0ACB6RNX1_9PLEO|nr:uncharacterized protein BU25DRAFT_451198 [Macroventuria anomochaeta]KAF2623721.1 hypothetical protein BU25DRAFT_451198 [Macroventuria anomochaeta]
MCVVIQRLTELHRISWVTPKLHISLKDLQRCQPCITLRLQISIAAGVRRSLERKTKSRKQSETTKGRNLENNVERETKARKQRRVKPNRTRAHLNRTNDQLQEQKHMIDGVNGVAISLGKVLQEEYGAIELLVPRSLAGAIVVVTDADNIIGNILDRGFLDCEPLLDAALLVDFRLDEARIVLDVVVHTVGKLASPQQRKCFGDLFVLLGEL